MPALGIPKKIGHIWIGSRPPPTHWMATWRERHPGWAYTLYDNAYLTGRRWRNQALIAEYFRRRLYAGVSDLMRYEILLDEGGFLPEADSTCRASCDALFDRPTAYTVYENERTRPGFVSPFLAAAPGHPFLDHVVRDIGARHTPETLRMPWISVGNRYLRDTIRAEKPDITIFPSHYFVPQHKDGPCYDGPDTVYADQHWGTTMERYARYPKPKERRIHEAVLADLRAGGVDGAEPDFPPPLQ